MKKNLSKFLSSAAILFLQVAPLAHLEADLVYATSLSNDVIQIIDTTTNTIIEEISTPDFTPRFIIFNPDNTLGYVIGRTSMSEQAVRVLDLATNTFTATIITGAPVQESWETITSDGSFIYVSNGTDATVSVIDTSLNSVVATVDVGDTPIGSVFVSKMGGDFIYVSNIGSEDLSVIDVDTNTVVATIDLGADARQLAVTLDNAFIYAPSGGEVYVINTTTNLVTATILLDISVNAIVADPLGASMYVSGSDTMNAISTATNTVTATISTSGTATPHYLAVTPDGAFIYIGSGPTPTGVLVIDIASGMEIAVVPDTDDNYGLAVLAAADDIVVAPPQGQQISNRFLTQTDLVNIITWSAPTGFTPVAYNIYRNSALTNLAGTVAADVFTFEDHNRVRKQFYTYFIVAVDDTEVTLLFDSVTVVPIL